MGKTETNESTSEQRTKLVALELPAFEMLREMADSDRRTLLATLGLIVEQEYENRGKVQP